MGIFRHLGITLSLVIAGHSCAVLLVRASMLPLSPPTLRWSKAVVGKAEHLPILVFITPTVLAVTGSLDQPLPAGLERRGTIELLDAQTGSLKETLSWSAPSSAPLFDSRAVLPLSGGRFLVQSWDLLRLFSPDGQVLKTRTLPLEGNQANYNSNITIWDRWDFGSSPDGNVVLATRHRPKFPEAEEHWLSGETLEDLRVETADSAHCCHAVGHEQVLYSAHLPEEPMVIRSKGGQPHPLCSKCCGGQGVFLDDTQVVLTTRPRGRFLVVSTSGEIRVDETLGGEDDRIIEVSVAPVSRQVAFLLGPQHLRDTPGEYSVYVYDSVLKKPIFKIQIPEHIHRDKPFVESITSPHIALSPGGKNLAILDDSVLRVYGTSP